MKYPKRCQYKHAKQKKYHVRNWAEYNEGLRRRGDLTVWFDEEAIANWKADKTGEPGGQRVYSDMAIETGLVVRMVYKLAYRQTEGFLHSIASLLGLGIEIPDYSTLSRRSRLLRKKLRIPKAASTQPIHLMIDSTGLRIHVGNARKPPKQRAWRKLHIAVDRETGNIVASELTASRARDATRVPKRFKEVQRLQTQLDQYTDLTDEQREQIEQALPKDDLRAFRGAYLETAQRLKEQQDTPGGDGEPANLEVDQLDFEFVLFASAVIDYDYIMKLIAKYSGQDPKKLTISREQLIGLIQSDAKFLDEREEITEYVRSLKAGEGLDEAAIRAGYVQFKAALLHRSG